MVNKINTQHFYNSEYGIYPEYLNYSVLIWAFFTVVPSTLAILMFFIGAFYFIKSYNTQGIKELMNGIHAISTIIIMFSLLWINTKIEKWNIFPLLADAYTISDCNIDNTLSQNWFIRKNHSTCYKVSFKRNFVPILAPFHAPKP